MRIFEKAGIIAIGSRLRLLTAGVTEDAKKIYELYGSDFAPKWFPVFFVLSLEESKTITAISIEIGHSQPSVTKIIKEMIKAGLVKDNLSVKDKRKNMAGLTEKGKMLAKKMTIENTDVEAAIESIMAEAKHNLWEAIAEWEILLEQKSLFKRVQEQKMLRESSDKQDNGI